jgi:CheY-like chemotaxis protein
MMVSSDVNRESELAVILPYKKVGAVKVDNNPAKLSLKTNPGTKLNEFEKDLPVLLVEDDQITQEVIKMFLSGTFEIDLAINAEEALHKIRQNEYMAVLMDINLGRGLNGLHITKEIRQLPGKNHLPIVAQTAFAMKGDKEEFFNAGCDYYLAKPFSKEELKDILLQIHGGSKA